MPSLSVSSSPLAELPKRITWLSIVISILLIVFGILAVLLPIGMSYSVVLISSWLLMIAGVIQFVHVFRCRGIGDALWKAAVAAAYFIAGIYLRVNIARGITVLTLVLAAFFVAEGIISLFAYFGTKMSRHSVWLLLEAIATLVLGLMIWRHWPSNSLWVIGLLVGINMVVTGSTRLMLTLALRNAVQRGRQEHLAPGQGA
jgi:uncharacterized membrane protein HdeD (DUF308 family)